MHSFSQYVVYIIILLFILDIMAYTYNSFINELAIQKRLYILDFIVAIS